jgi:hypothetical protein
MKRLHLLLVALLACGLFAAGCGDDDDNNDSSDEPATTESAPADTTAETTEEEAPPVETTEEETDAPEDIPELDGELRDQAVESCKESVASAPQLSDDVKGDLEEICEQAAEGDEDAVRDASVEVCKKIVEDSVPAGPAREQALASCDQAG